MNSKFIGGFRKTASILSPVAELGAKVIGLGAKAAIKNPLGTLNQVGNVASAYEKGTSTAAKLRAARNGLIG